MEHIFDLYFLPPQEKQYAHWMAACRLASKGKTMADSSYNLEVQNILSFLKMQHMNPDPQFIEAITTDINPECLVSPRYLKKYKNKQVSRCKMFSVAGRWHKELKIKLCDVGRVFCSRHGQMMM